MVAAELLSVMFRQLVGGLLCAWKNSLEECLLLRTGCRHLPSAVYRHQGLFDILVYEVIGIDRRHWCGLCPVCVVCPIHIYLESQPSGQDVIEVL